MRVYIATKFEEADAARALAHLLEDAGHTITYKWWENGQVTAAQATHDALGVENADALIFIAYRKLAYCGALVEMGMAIMRGIPVYVLGTGINNCIFTMLPTVHHVYDSLDTFISKVLK